MLNVGKNDELNQRRCPRIMIQLSRFRLIKERLRDIYQFLPKYAPVIFSPIFELDGPILAVDFETPNPLVLHGGSSFKS